MPSALSFFPEALPSGNLVSLGTVDYLVIAIYFAFVLGIGFYLKHFADTGEEFFMAGREMTAWIAGLAFISANLGALELLGWAGNTYEYGIMAAHWYWIGAIPAMLFLGLVMMPFYYISKTHSVPRFLLLRFGPAARTLSATTFAFMTVLMSGINMYAMAKVMQVVLGWDINFSMILSSVTVALYVGLGGLLSAILMKSCSSCSSGLVRPRFDRFGLHFSTRHKAQPSMNFNFDKLCSTNICQLVP
jgi:SSS family solute:Na+ symporter